MEDDPGSCPHPRQNRNFNPRPPCGGRQNQNNKSSIAKHFNPRPPCGGRPLICDTSLHGGGFQSTSPVWRTTVPIIIISRFLKYFNPRPPCGGRPKPPPQPPLPNPFQSTSPVWRTTSPYVFIASYNGDFNPRPPCGGRRSRSAADTTPTRFQSTSPVWRTTLLSTMTKLCRPISIHVPRVEDDDNVLPKETV